MGYSVCLLVFFFFFGLFKYALQVNFVLLLDKTIIFLRFSLNFQRILEIESFPSHFYCGIFFGMLCHFCKHISYVMENETHYSYVALFGTQRLELHPLET